MSESLENRNYYVYMYTSPSGKHYVGRTYKTKEKRAGAKGIGYRNCTAFWNAIQKYGWENFKYEVLETHISINDIDEREKYWIGYYHSSTNENGYNLVIPNKNNSFKTFTDEMRKRMSESCKGRIPWNKGKTNVYTKEQLNRMSKSLAGRPSTFLGKRHTDESKQKISESRKGKMCGVENYWYGKHIPEEIKKKMSEKRKDYFYGENSPIKDKFAVMQFDLNGNYIRTFKTQSEAARHVGCCKNAICECCLGRYKSAGGFQWCKVGDENKIGKYKKNKSYSNGIPIPIVQIKDNHIINVFESICSASKITGVDRTCISACTRGVRKTASGFQWQRLSDVNQSLIDEYYARNNMEVDDYAS